MGHPSPPSQPRPQDYFPPSDNHRRNWNIRNREKSAGDEVGVIGNNWKKVGKDYDQLMY